MVTAGFAADLWRFYLQSPVKEVCHCPLTFPPGSSYVSLVHCHFSQLVLTLEPALPSISLAAYNFPLTWLRKGMFSSRLGHSAGFVR